MKIIDLQLDTIITHKVIANMPTTIRVTSDSDQFTFLQPSYVIITSFRIIQFIHRSSSAFSLDPFHLQSLLLTSAIDASSTAKSFAAHSIHFHLATYFVLP